MHLHPVFFPPNLKLNVISYSLGVGILDNTGRYSLGFGFRNTVEMSLMGLKMKRIYCKLRETILMHNIQVGIDQSIMQLILFSSVYTPVHISI